MPNFGSGQLLMLKNEGVENSKGNKRERKNFLLFHKGKYQFCFYNNCQQSVSSYVDNCSCTPTLMQLNLMRLFWAEFFLFGLRTQETSNLSHQKHCIFCASNLVLKRKKKNLKMILKYTCLENSSKHELEEELGGAGREDGSNKWNSTHCSTI